MLNGKWKYFCLVRFEVIEHQLQLNFRIKIEGILLQIFITFHRFTREDLVSANGAFLDTSLFYILADFLLFKPDNFFESHFSFWSSRNLEIEHCPTFFSTDILNSDSLLARFEDDNYFLYFWLPNSEKKWGHSWRSTWYAWKMFCNELCVYGLHR